MTMRTIEAEATITEAGTLVVPVSRDILPGNYHVVVVIDASPVEVEITQLDDKQALFDLAGTWSGDDLDERLAEVHATRCTSLYTMISAMCRGEPACSPAPNALGISM